MVSSKREKCWSAIFFLSTLARFHLRPINPFYTDLRQFYLEKRNRRLRFCSTLRLIYRAFSTATVHTFKFSSIFPFFRFFFFGSLHLIFRERENQISFSLGKVSIVFLGYRCSRKR